MDCPTTETDDTPALRRAAQGFARGLARDAALDDVARVEARLAIDDPGALFALDEALAAVWPLVPGAPQREVIWAQASSAEPGSLTLSAFDAAGRVLLRRTYAAAVGRKSAAAAHV